MDSDNEPPARTMRKRILARVAGAWSRFKAIAAAGPKFLYRHRMLLALLLIASSLAQRPTDASIGECEKRIGGSLLVISFYVQHTDMDCKLDLMREEGDIRDREREAELSQAKLGNEALVMKATAEAHGTVESARMTAIGGVLQAAATYMTQHQTQFVDQLMGLLASAPPIPSPAPAVKETAASGNEPNRE